MASRWMREICYDYSGSSSARFWNKCYALWLYYVMDFSLQSQYCSTTGDWIGVEKSGGTHGAFSGSDFNFTTSGGDPAFGPTDRGKILIIQDNNHPENAGLYVITAYNSTTSVLIDFRAGTLEYPTASTDLSWWVCGPTYKVPIDQDWIHLQSRHTTGWAVEVKCQTGSFSEPVVFRVAPLGNWSGAVIGDFAADNVDPVRRMTGITNSHGGGGVSRQTFWAEGDYDNCEWVHMWSQNPSSGGGSGAISHDNAIMLVSIERMTPIEVGTPDSDLIVLKGPNSWYGRNTQDQGDRRFGLTVSAYDYNFGRGTSWCTDKGGEMSGFCVDYSYAGYQSSFARQYRREQNIRRGDKLEAFVGEPYIIDPTNMYGYYRFLGYMKGHWIVPLLAATSVAASITHLTANRVIHKMAPINMGAGSDRNRLHITDGIVIPWCGLSLIGQGLIF